MGPRPQAVHEVVQGVDRDPELERGGKGLSLAIAAASCSRRAMHMSSGTSDGVCSGPSSVSTRAECGGEPTLRWTPHAVARWSRRSCFAGLSGQAALALLQRELMARFDGPCALRAP